MPGLVACEDGAVSGRRHGREESFAHRVFGLETAGFTGKTSS
jgi:hypothetical protein